MQRRSLLRALALVGLAAPAAAAAQEARARRVVYQIDDVGKVALAFVNMRNHRLGGPDGLELCAVVYGPALGDFLIKAGNAPLVEELAARRAAGDVFYACANTLAAHQWRLDDLAPGFALADKGGVVKLADLQAQGWIYLRP